MSHTVTYNPVYTYSVPKRGGHMGFQARITVEGSTARFEVPNLTMSAADLHAIADMCNEAARGMENQ
jgi:hypothetical protein